MEEVDHPIPNLVTLSVPFEDMTILFPMWSSPAMVNFPYQDHGTVLSVYGKSQYTQFTPYSLLSTPFINVYAIVTIYTMMPRRRHLWWKYH